MSDSESKSDKNNSDSNSNSNNDSDSQENSSSNISKSDESKNEESFNNDSASLHNSPKKKAKISNNKKILASPGISDIPHVDSSLETDVKNAKKNKNDLLKYKNNLNTNRNSKYNTNNNNFTFKNNKVTDDTSSANSLSHYFNNNQSKENRMKQTLRQLGKINSDLDDMTNSLNYFKIGKIKETVHNEDNNKPLKNETYCSNFNNFNAYNALNKITPTFKDTNFKNNGYNNYNINEHNNKYGKSENIYNKNLTKLFDDLDDMNNNFDVDSIRRRTKEKVMRNYISTNRNNNDNNYEVYGDKSNINDYKSSNIQSNIINRMTTNPSFNKINNNFQIQNSEKFSLQNKKIGNISDLNDKNNDINELNINREMSNNSAINTNSKNYNNPINYNQSNNNEVNEYLVNTESQNINTHNNIYLNKKLKEKNQENYINPKYEEEYKSKFPLEYKFSIPTVPTISSQHRNTTNPNNHKKVDNVDYMDHNNSSTNKYNNEDDYNDYNNKDNRAIRNIQQLYQKSKTNTVTNKSPIIFSNNNKDTYEGSLVVDNKFSDNAFINKNNIESFNNPNLNSYCSINTRMNNINKAINTLFSRESKELNN